MLFIQSTTKLSLVQFSSIHYHFELLNIINIGASNQMAIRKAIPDRSFGIAETVIIHTFRVLMNLIHCCLPLIMFTIQLQVSV